ncbi:MAG: polyprenyl synthetase family protein [Planctomycetes bacterium]|nr:polyprenyl synthetase family protein [Planctomycetota bacterium]
MRWSVLGGGKRLRPALVLLGARAAGGDEASVLGVACAVEFLHTYSLIHDDLPAMDDDDYRRGRLSCHAKFDEATAILAGDALNTHAFGLLATTSPDPSRVASLVAELAAASGTHGMVGGQCADLEGEGGAPDELMVRSIHERKTGALITASLRMGAIAVGADNRLLADLGEFARRLGLAFQIVDDVLDEEGAAVDLGKTPGKDRAQGKVTYPAAIGVAASRARADELVRDAAPFAAGTPATPQLISLAAYVLARHS